MIFQTIIDTWIMILGLGLLAQAAPELPTASDLIRSPEQGVYERLMKAPEPVTPVKRKAPAVEVEPKVRGVESLV
ncbi:MAG: hypothetical protein FJ118_13880 [Deltaproteobacteria bacterium]|nr:hypothetical protein [Deltaproteobacteria bacterium]